MLELVELVKRYQPAAARSARGRRRLAVGLLRRAGCVVWAERVRQEHAADAGRSGPATGLGQNPVGGSRRLGAVSQAGSALPPMREVGFIRQSLELIPARTVLRAALKLFGDRAGVREGHRLVAPLLERFWSSQSACITGQRSSRWASANE